MTRSARRWASNSAASSAASSPCRCRMLEINAWAVGSVSWSNLRLQRGGCRFGIKAGGGDALVAEEALQIGDVHAERKQAGCHCVAQQMWVDTFANPGSNGDGADDLADPLACQHVWCWPGTFLTAGEQWPCPPRADMQPQQLRQVAPDRHLSALSALALADGDHALDEADVLDAKLHKLGGSGAGFQQCLQHQPGAAVLGVRPVKKPQLFLDGQPIDAAPTFRGGPQTGAFPGSFEDGFALHIVHALTHENGGDGGGGMFDGGHQSVCSMVSGVQTHGSLSAHTGQSSREPACWTGLELSTPAIVESSLAGDRERRFAMHVKVLLQITADDGTAADAAEVAVFEKQTERPEDLGLSIVEGKALMAAVQQRLVYTQAMSWAERQRCCEACGTRRHSKGSYPVIFMTLYGDVKLSSPRLHRCPCQGATVRRLCRRCAF